MGARRLDWRAGQYVKYGPRGQVCRVWVPCRGGWVYEAAVRHVWTDAEGRRHTRCELVARSTDEAEVLAALETYAHSVENGTTDDDNGASRHGG